MTRQSSLSLPSRQRQLSPSPPPPSYTLFIVISLLHTSPGAAQLGGRSAFVPATDDVDMFNNASCNVFYIVVHRRTRPVSTSRRHIDVEGVRTISAIYHGVFDADANII